MGYEYKVVKGHEFSDEHGYISKSKIQEILTEHGKQGWRFVQTISQDGWTAALVFEKVH